jgi:hypothetical protein
MAERTSMSQLIAYVRRLLKIPDESSELDNQDIQDALDVSRIEVAQWELEGVPFVQSDGKIVYHWFNTPMGGAWDREALIQGASWETLTPDVEKSDYINGRFYFTTPRTLGVYITGGFYDVFAAAADVIDGQLLSGSLNAFDFTADGLTVARSQKIGNLSTMAAGFRAKSRPITISVCAR